MALVRFGGFQNFYDYKLVKASAFPRQICLDLEIDDWSVIKVTVQKDMINFMALLIKLTKHSTFSQSTL